jgi:nitroreductase
MIKDLVLKNRSYRRFDESHRISEDELLELVELARVSPSSRNQQALKFALTSEREKCDELFKYLAWAGYIPEWDGPIEGERPSGYIIIYGDKNLGSQFATDVGIAAQTILLGAAELGLGGCMIGSIKRNEFRSHFQVPEKLEILLVLAIGKPVETVVIDDIKEDDIKYWRDSEGVHHVPKRKTCDMLITL